MARVLRNELPKWVETPEPDDVFLPPSDPSKILGLAYNYKSLVGRRDTYEEPLFFLKSPTSARGHDARVARGDFERVWVESELTIVIKKECRNVSASEAPDYILGYTIGSDVTALNVHERDWHLARSKAIDGFAPMGPYLVTGIDTADLELGTRINGREYQRGRTSDRIINDAEAVSLLSRFVTLSPGDVIMTGTPAGATSSLVRAGDVVTHWIEGLGELRFTMT